MIVERVCAFEIDDDGMFVMSSKIEGTGVMEKIVRCRDCVHWRPPDKMHQSRCDGVFAFVKPNPDGFCAWGRID